MTKNQIEYAKLRETIRNNTAQEGLTRKRDEAARVLGINTLAESSRHNQAVEVLDTAKLGETKRSNLAREAETQRSNVAKETETNRANVAREVETERHQKASEAIDIGRAATTAAQAAETVRSNLARESETTRHNLVMESKNLQPQVITTVNPGEFHDAPVVIDLEPATNQLSRQKDVWSVDTTRAPSSDKDGRFVWEVNQYGEYRKHYTGDNSSNFPGSSRGGGFSSRDTNLGS